MATFRLLIDYDVAVMIERLPKRLRQAIRLRLIEIRDYPANRTDYTEQDSAGRGVAINICGAFAIKFWVDHADRQIKILDIHPSDRRL
ncbi:MAG: hypothetical protein EXS37_15175 [Opitutus sp.]|nr:hypothetical protein [Opitutus sp.]